MSSPIYVLGTGLSHNGSAVLLKDGIVCYGIEKERLTRKKHDGGNDSLAIQYCLDAEGITLNDVSLVVQCANFELPDPAYFHGKRLFGTKNGPKVIDIPHHLAHAYSAVGTSPFKECAVMVIDGCGSPMDQVLQLSPLVEKVLTDAQKTQITMQCEKDSFYHFDGQTLHPLFKDFSEMSGTADLRLSTTKHSIGGFYAAISNYVFGNLEDVGKLMGLAPFGSHNYSHKAFEFVNDRLMLRADWDGLLIKPASDYQAVQEDWTHYTGIAKWAQEQIEWALDQLFERRLRDFPHKNVCYSGGVALNAVANSKLLASDKIENFHLEPAAGDNGLALGCAFYGWLAHLKKPRVLHNGSTCFGKSYDGNSLLQIDPKARVFETDNALNEYCAKILTEGKTIAWFQGGSEFGPRALGHRSILAHPGIEGMKDRINGRIKFREDFRPFAPAVLEENVSRYFEKGWQSPYMILVDQTKEAYRDVLKNVTHADGSARVQTVTKEWNPRFTELLRAFEIESGVGVLLNTSLNRKGMPIVETPKEALQLFKETDLDVLVVENVLLEKSNDKSAHYFDQIEAFLTSIGISIVDSQLDDACFLPGLRLHQTSILCDRSQLLSVGDILHEAGHIAVTAAEIRHLIGTDQMANDWPTDGDEITAILWSFAAAKHLNIPLEVVFHTQGYKGEATWIVDQMNAENYLGLPLLEWFGMCYAPENTPENSLPFPHMIQWLRK